VRKLCTIGAAALFVLACSLDVRAEYGTNETRGYGSAPSGGRGNSGGDYSGNNTSSGYLKGGPGSKTRMASGPGRSPTGPASGETRSGNGADNQGYER
jgi:hypothetical protein